MGSRLQLQTLLESIVDHVYFQPPSNVQLQYPCVVYRRDTARSQFAGNTAYRLTIRYEVTVIDRDPDSAIPGKVAEIPMCILNRTFVVDNLHHDVFQLYWKGFTV